MIAVTFDGLVGALHLPEADRPLDHAVVLCPAFGYESLCSHRGLVALAEDLAACGVVALRIDYLGQGDSADLAPEADAVAAWLCSIEAAARWVEARFPGIAITLAGYRLGALLAASAAPRIARLRSLVLIAPVTSGKAYLRELTLLGGRAPEPEGLDAAGWPLSTASVGHLGLLSLHYLEPCRGRDILLVTETPSHDAARLAARLAAPPGALFTALVGADLGALNQHAHRMAVPEASFAAIVAWIAARPVPARPPTPTPVFAAAELALPHSHEQAIRLGPDGALFGIASIPRDTRPGLPCLLLLNTGGNPRSGHGRLSVRIARVFAAAGIASLRLDVTGTGDARPVLRGPNSILYSAERCGDLAAALDWIAARGWGAGGLLRPVFGGYVGLNGGVRDDRVAGIVLVNPQSFLWDENLDIDAALDVSLRAVESYLPRLRQQDFWVRLLRGRTRIRGILGGLARHYAGAWAAALQAHLPNTIGVAPRALKVAAHFDRLAARSVPVLIVYSRGDPGLNELTAIFGSGGRRLARQPQVAIRYIEDADHTLTSAPAKRALLAMLAEFLQARFETVQHVQEKEEAFFL